METGSEAEVSNQAARFGFNQMARELLMGYKREDTLSYVMVKLTFRWRRLEKELTEQRDFDRHRGRFGSGIDVGGAGNPEAPMREQGRNQQPVLHRKHLPHTLSDWLSISRFCWTNLIG